MPILSLGSAYLLSLSGATPHTLAVQLETADVGYWVDVALCYPSGAAVVGVARGTHAAGTRNPQHASQQLTGVDSIAEVAGAAGEAYYWCVGAGWFA